jgi:hypothetical protein
MLDLNLNGMDKDLFPTLSTKSFVETRTASERLGYGGLLVVHGFGDDVGGTGLVLHAYDLSCPNEARPDIRILPDSTGLRAICSVCGATFGIAYVVGAPESGSKHFLRSYRVFRVDEYRYRVTN